MIVVDTSALVAVLSGEPERERINAALAVSTSTLMSAANYLECSIVLASRYGEAATHDLALYLHEAGIDMVPVDHTQADAAFEAWQRYGKGRHPAAPNFGDCFAYALARTRGARLLFVGDDFTRACLTALP